MMTIVEDTYVCNTCGKRWIRANVRGRRGLRNHLEAHLNLYGFPCQHCDLVSKSRDALKKHMYRSHKDIKFNSSTGPSSLSAHN
jgi:hypothetical protein